MMTCQTVSPARARRLVEDGAALIDVRSPAEFARVHVPGARNVPLGSGEPVGAGPAVFLCKSGMRTGANRASLAALCDGESYVLDGGLDAWRTAGLPVAEDRSQPIEIMRQVQIAAGVMILAGVLLGFTVAPGWFGLSAFVGAGLTFAGVPGWCGMAHLLAVMPWNRRAAATSV